MIFILDNFFIQLTDSIIKLLVFISNLFISLFNRKNGSNSSNDSIDSNDFENINNLNNSNDFKFNKSHESGESNQTKGNSEYNFSNRTDLFEYNYFNESNLDDNDDNYGYDFDKSQKDFSNRPDNDYQSLKDINENFEDKDDISSLFGLDLSKFFKNEGIFEELENRYISSQRVFLTRGPVLEDKKRNPFFDIKSKLIGFLFNNPLFLIKNSRDLLKLCAVLFFILIVIFLFVIYFVSFELGLALLMSVFLITSLITYYPKIRKDNDYSTLSKELPYALRQLSTELRAGKSLYDALDSIVESGYGILSLEFSRVLEEIRYGESTETAFLNLEKRVNSKAFSRVIFEILSSLRIGSNLSHSLNIIAEDVSFDMRMKLKEYSEKLNAFIMIYTFLAILAPVIILTMLLAASVVIGDVVPSDLLLILYGVFFPMIIVFLAFTVKILEPKL